MGMGRLTLSVTRASFTLRLCRAAPYCPGTMHAVSCHVGYRQSRQAPTAEAAQAPCEYRMRQTGTRGTGRSHVERWRRAVSVHCVPCGSPGGLHHSHTSGAWNVLPGAEESWRSRLGGEGEGPGSGRSARWPCAATRAAPNWVAVAAWVQAARGALAVGKCARGSGRQVGTCSHAGRGTEACMAPAGGQQCMGSVSFSPCGLPAGCVWPPPTAVRNMPMANALAWLTADRWPVKACAGHLLVVHPDSWSHSRVAAMRFALPLGLPCCLGRQVRFEVVAFGLSTLEQSSGCSVPWHRRLLLV